eukprot:7784067-Heterocapsa_arctica.AAC.1
MRTSTKCGMAIESMATEYHYLRAGEPLGQPKDRGKVLWSKEFPKPKRLESEASSEEQDVRVL